MTTNDLPVRAVVAAMSGYIPGEQPRDRQYIKLNTNENPYPPSPRVIEALHAAISENLKLYPDPIATGFRVAAAAVYGVSPDHLLAGNGSDDLLAILVRACADPVGSPGATSRAMRIAYPVPTYTLYDTLATIQACEIAPVPFDKDFTLPVDALVERDARLTIVCNPNAPSGTTVPIEQVEELVRRSRGLVAIDEAYVDFAKETCLPLVKKHDNVIVLRTMSKSYSLAGMRIGLAIANPEIIRQLHKVKDSYNMNRLSLVAAEAAIQDQAHMRCNAAKIVASRTALVASLRALGLEVLESQTNFVLARLPGQEMKSVYVGLKTHGILVRYFDKPGLTDAIRISVGLPEENAALLAALEAVLRARSI